MDAWIDIRRKSQACHEAALTTVKGDRRARALAEAALQLDDLEIRYYEPGSIVNTGVFGFLDRPSKLVNIAKHQDPHDEVVVIAHEIGHFKLHQDPASEVTVRSDRLGGDIVDSGAGRVEGYSPRERKEIQADVFAGEFFCPSNWLRNEFIQHGKRPSQLAAELGLPPNLVLNQFVRALLLPPLRAGTAAAGSNPGTADCQSRAGRESKDCRNLERRAFARRCRSRDRQDKNPGPQNRTSPAGRRTAVLDSRVNLLEQGRR